MRFLKFTARFGTDETGAVTVDWVVLTALVVGLVGLAMAGLRGNMSSVGDKVSTHLSSANIVTTF